MNKKFSFEEYLKENPTPAPAVDIIIKYRGGVVLIDRKYPPLGFAFPGGISVKGLSYEQIAIKESKEETGLDIIITDLKHKPFLSYSDPDDDPRYHIPTTVYRAIGRGILKPDKKEDAKKAWVVNYEELKKLVYEPSVWSMERHRDIATLFLKEENYL